MVDEALIALLNDASSKASTGDLLGALDGYSKATLMDQRSSTAWYGLGVVHAKRGDTDMAIPAFEKDFEKQRQYLNELAAEFARLQEIFPTMDTLSMGMSNDYEAAIAEQSSMVRLGTVIFGPRV